MKFNKYISTLISFCFLFFTQACVDDSYIPLPEEEDKPDYSDVPEDMLEGFTLSFKISLDGMEGNSDKFFSRAGEDEIITNEYLRDIENFVDLEKLRILFFTCLDNSDQKLIDGKTYETGKHDIFLFESKSRWVSILTDAESTSSSWQVTAPIYTYGNNDEYDWTYIREALTQRPFKIVILANRPDQVRYSDFDGTYGQDEFYFGNRGPYWSVAESNRGRQDFYKAKEFDFTNLDGKMTLQGTSINGLHHCQWDPVYANKNLNYNYYDFILGNPSQTKEDDGVSNWMGAVSYWTKWRRNEDDSDWIRNPNDKNNTTGLDRPYNFYYHPDRSQGIPMYGVQKFDAIDNWRPGTPINVSERQVGQSGTYMERKDIYLLRSLARIDLVIPKNLVDEVIEPCLMYSNVFGRCEPLDVATPTNILWDDNHDDCEWHRLAAYGPVINGDLGQKANKNKFLERMAWYYGAWQDWGWDFNGELEPGDDKFSAVSKKNYPRIFNTCIQRNGTARIEDVIVDDPEYFHYVVYCGERNINDPSNFGKLDLPGSEHCYFKFNARKTDSKGVVREGSYCIAITNYDQNVNSIVKNILGTKTDLGDYRTTMGGSTNPGDWNWPIMRNHVYTFRVTSIFGNTDTDGINVRVVSSENRSTPTIEFN